MKKIFALFFFFFIAIDGQLLAQCAAFVQIQPSPAGQICKGETINFIANPINGGPTPVYYWILNGDTVSYTDTYTSSFMTDITIQVVMISSLDCDPDTVYATYDVDVMNFTAEGTTKTIYCNDESADIQLTNKQDGQEPYQFVLDGNSVGSSGSFSQVAPGSHLLEVTDANGCKDTVSIVVIKEECPPVEPLPAISPNDDGINDFWIIRNIEKFPDNKVYIYDRWGQRVFFKKGYKNRPEEGWQGTYLGLPLPEAAYYYVIELNAEDSEGNKRVKGAVSIVR